LQQVLINLVGNAIKFTDEGAVRVDAFMLPVRQGNSHLILFSVADTGIGITDESLRDLFKAFSQVTEGYMRSHQGAGLGLSICKRLVELMGGSICVVSEPGVGSSFWFSLPFDAAEQTMLSRLSRGVKPERPSLVGLAILLVEDDVISAFAAVRLMEKRGIRVRHVVHGAQALDALRAGSFDLVLMDVQMPVMDGVTATQSHPKRRSRRGGPKRADCRPDRLRHGWGHRNFQGGGHGRLSAQARWLGRIGSRDRQVAFRQP
jgi:hypothetical protein